MIPHSSHRLLYATIAALTAIEFLQLSMTAFAAAPIMGELGMSPEDFSLANAVYASVAILAISMQRWFVERIGGRRFIRCATAISILGSVLCATSDDFAAFLLGRIVMAIGGGALFTSARMIIHHLLAGPRQFRHPRAGHQSGAQHRRWPVVSRRGGIGRELECDLLAGRRHGRIRLCAG